MCKINTMLVEIPNDRKGVLIKTSTGHDRFSGDLGMIPIITDSDKITASNVTFRAAECWRNYAESQGYTFELL